MGSLRADSSGAPSLQNSKTSSPSLPPTNDDIEAVIREATSARSTPDGRGGGPLKDTRTQLFVGNLPYRVRWQDLKDLFRKAGTVLRADVSLGPDNRSRGYGTVLLSSAEDAGRAVDMFNGYSWQTRILEVRPDRLPPDFENPMGLPIMPGNMPGFPSTLSNSPMSASPFAPAGQTHPSMPTTMGGNGASSMADDFDYTSFYMHEAPGPGPNGGRNLFVGNLPFHCQWQDLKDLFRQAGTIIRADVALGQDGRSRGFGTVVFATDVDADRAVKMFNGYEYNGRQLKVHYDRFSQSSQPATAPTSPTLSSAYPNQSQAFGSYAPSHIPLPAGYPFNMGAMSGPSSPYGGPPPMAMAQPHPSQTYGLSVEQLTGSLASARLGGRAPSTSSETPSNASLSPRPPNQNPKHQNHTQHQPQHNHHHAQQQLQQQQQQYHQQQQQHHHPNNHHANRPGSIALPPPPSAHAFPMPLPHNLSPHPASPLHHPMAMHYQMMTPHGLPPITPSMPSFSFLPQPSPHLPGSPGHLQMLQSYAANAPAIHAHAAHVLSTLSPGVTMSPGAFWGRPGGGGANPFINPAVGAPVHGSPGGFFAMNMHPISPAASAGGEESAGYFPPVPAEAGYFPQMASSRLAHEIMRDKTSPDEAKTPGSASSDTTDMGTRSERRTSSSTGTSWHTPEEATTEAMDAAEKEASSVFSPDDESDAAEGSPGGLLEAGGPAVARTNSMSAPKTSDRVPMIRGGSDPVHTVSAKDERRNSATGERPWGMANGGLAGMAIAVDM